jgi:hypothetical protein
VALGRGEGFVTECRRDQVAGGSRRHREETADQICEAPDRWPVQDEGYRVTQ